MHDRVRIEARSLRIDQWCMLLFAAVGLLVYFQSGAAAMALDAMYSLIGFGTAWVAGVVLRSARQGADRQHPFGRGPQESLYVLFRSLLLIGVVLASVVGAVGELWAYFVEGVAVEPDFGIVAIYGLFLAVACGALAWMHAHYARVVGGSAILEVESTAARIDAWIGLGLAISLGAVALIPDGTPITSEAFSLKATADGIVVLVLSAVLVRSPIRSLIEETRRLAGVRVDSVSDAEIRRRLIRWLPTGLGPHFRLVDVYVVHHGGSVSVDLALAYPGEASVRDLDGWYEQVAAFLADDYPGLVLTVSYSEYPLHVA